MRASLSRPLGDKQVAAPYWAHFARAHSLCRSTSMTTAISHSRAPQTQPLEIHQPPRRAGLPSQRAEGGVSGSRAGRSMQSTGVILATEASYTEGTGTDRTANARIDGRIHGLGGGAVAGLFTTISGATTYVGGFVGAGAQVASDLYTGSGTTGNSIGQANWAEVPTSMSSVYVDPHGTHSFPWRQLCGKARRTQFALGDGAQSKHSLQSCRDGNRAGNGRDGKRQRQSHKIHRCKRPPRQRRHSRTGDNLAGRQLRRHDWLRSATCLSLAAMRCPAHSPGRTIMRVPSFRPLARHWTRFARARWR